MGIESTTRMREDVYAPVVGLMVAIFVPRLRGLHVAEVDVDRAVDLALRAADRIHAGLCARERATSIPGGKEPR